MPETVLKFLVAFHQRNQWIEIEIESGDLTLEQAKQIIDTLRSDYERIAVFRHRLNWHDYKPYCLIDNREKKDCPIIGLGGLIDSLDSSWF